MIELVTPDTPEDAAPVVIFAIDGKSYSIPDRLSPSLSLRYLHVIRTQGLVAAQDWLLQAALGEEAHAALLNWEHITTEQVALVLAAVRRVVFGETDTSPTDKRAATPGKGGRPATPRKRKPTTRTR